VKSGQPQLREVHQHRVPNDAVHEPNPARARLGQQSGDHTGLERVEDGVFVGVGGGDDDIHIGLFTDDRGEAQHGDVGGRQPGQPSAEDVAHTFGNLGDGDELALARQ
jgi:hypothetical protein